MRMQIRLLPSIKAALAAGEAKSIDVDVEVKETKLDFEAQMVLKRHVDGSFWLTLASISMFFHAFPIKKEAARLILAIFEAYFCQEPSDFMIFALAVWAPELHRRFYQWAFLYGRASAHIHAYIHTYIHTYRSTYIHTYIHTSIHPYIPTCNAY